jgi:streptomycin 6-kinase
MGTMEIPEYFRVKASRQFGDDGPAWVESLPSILKWCLETWQLGDCRPVDGLSINLVCLAESPRFGSVVLKVQGPHTERYTEMEALRAYAGRRTCALLGWDRPQAAMLLERLMPGTTLRSLPDRNEQLRIGAEIMAALPVSPEGTRDLPTYQDWITRAFARMRRDFDPDATMQRLMAAAQDLYTEARAARQGGDVILHGDLHHDNILSAGDGKWKVIDPQGVIGPAFMECGRFIQNHALMDVREMNEGEVTHAVLFVADRLAETPRRIASALFVLHVLSVCWSHEMNDEPEELRLQWRQCETLLALVGRIGRGEGR